MIKEIRNLYVNANGDINFNKGVKLASLNDLENWLCGTGEAVEGFIQTNEGIHYWQSAESMEEMAGENIEVDSGVYHFIDSNVPTIYKHFIEQIDPVLYEIITMKMSNDNRVLYAVTLPRQNNFYHIHNVWFDGEEIQENCSMVPRIFVDMYIA